MQDKHESFTSLTKHLKHDYGIHQAFRKQILSKMNCMHICQLNTIATT